MQQLLQDLNVQLERKGGSRPTGSIGGLVGLGLHGEYEGGFLLLNEIIPLGMCARIEGEAPVLLKLAGISWNCQ